MTIRDQIMGQLKDIEYVSFDIFDTLIFRMTRTPSQIFDKMYKARPEIFPKHISSCEWRHMRIYAEADARKKRCGEEITLEDIYQHIPAIIEDSGAVMELEIQTEMENTFLNPEMESILYEVKEKYRKKIILTSDMYLSKESIAGILRNCGMDMSLLEEIFVSSQCGKKKSNGTLFSYINRRLNCHPEQILHIGDNWKSDYLHGKKSGWRVIYYPLISEAECRYPYLGYERGYYGDIGNDIYAMRILAAESSEMDGEERKWFEMGAMAFGPLFTYAVEWVLDLAKENGIHHIFPMMRDGYFLMTLLKNAADKRHWEGCIAPMYISRKALYPALNAMIEEKDIENLLDTKYMTVGKIMDLLGLDINEMGYFKEYRDWDLETCKGIFVDGVSLYQKMKSALTSDKMIQKIRMDHADGDKKVWDYFVSLKMDREDYLTFDIGWKGTSQNAVERICQRRKAASRGLHLLVISRIAMLKNRSLGEKTDIRGFTGNMREVFKKNTAVLSVVAELFLICREGTTVGYRYNKGKIHPVCKTIAYSEQQLKYAKAAQEGILSFQKLYFSLRTRREKISEQDRDELYKMAARLMSMPTRKEARLIGSVIFDENLGDDRMWQLIEPQRTQCYGQLGYNEFCHQKYARHIEWYQGMDSILDGLIYYKGAMFHMREEIPYKYAMYAERICRRFKRFVLAGAGMRARTLLMFLEMMDETDRVEFIVDNNPLVWQEKICEKTVYPIGTQTESGCYCLTVMDNRAIAELEEQLKCVSPKCRIYHIGL